MFEIGAISGTNSISMLGVPATIVKIDKFAKSNACKITKVTTPKDVKITGKKGWLSS